MGLFDFLKSGKRYSHKEIYYDYYRELYTKTSEQKDLLFELVKAFREGRKDDRWQIHSQIVDRTSAVTEQKILSKYHISSEELDNIIKEAYENYWPDVRPIFMQILKEKEMPEEIALAYFASYG